MEEENKYKIEQKVIGVLKTIYDPEIPVNIYDLGLVYSIKVNDNGKVDIEMTLTSPNCPVAESLPVEVEKKVISIKDVSDVHIEIVWDPPWNYDMMTEAAKLELGML
jgi:FeS assembly SUF system protein